MAQRVSDCSHLTPVATIRTIPDDVRRPLQDFALRGFAHVCWAFDFAYLADRTDVFLMHIDNPHHSYLFAASQTARASQEALKTESLPRYDVHRHHSA
jgi:hypothetical protein